MIQISRFPRVWEFQGQQKASVRRHQKPLAPCIHATAAETTAPATRATALPTVHKAQETRKLLYSPSFDSNPLCFDQAKSSGHLDSQGIKFTQNVLDARNEMAMA